MGINEFGEETPQGDEEDSESVSYVYIRHPAHSSNGPNYPQGAYDLVSQGGLIRRYFNSAQSDYDDIHEFSAAVFVAMEPLLRDGNWEPILGELGVPAEGIAQYLDNNPEVRDELADLMNSTE